MKKVLIIGGGFDNKGAQAMSFACVDQIRKMKKKYEPVLCLERKVTKEEQEKYNFSIVEMNRLCELRGNILLWLLIFFKSTKEERKQYQYFCQVLKETVCVIDISGFQLSSKWTLGAVIGYLTRIGFYHKRGIKVLIFPQSFGPIEYPFVIQKLIDCMIRKNLRYPEKIYAREKEGYDLLAKEYGLKNVYLSPDLVLLHNDMKLENIYYDYCKKEFKINPESVCIIPNIRVEKKIKEENLILIYEKIVDNLLEKRKNVYLLNHSKEDRELCIKIKEKFAHNDKVRLILDDMSCHDYCDLVKQFDFVIASRFHSIIHAYKEGIPAIILGWAIKYAELAGLFGQERYQLMLRKKEDIDIAIAILNQMLEKYKEEGKKIKDNLKKLQNKYEFTQYFISLDMEDKYD